MRSAATGSEYNGGGGAGVAAVMKLAPNVDVEALQVLIFFSICPAPRVFEPTEKWAERVA